MITFTVRGLPAPQGSKRAFRNKHSGRIQQVESSKRVAPWRSDVRDAALAAIENSPLCAGGPLAGPVRVQLDFRLPRPKGHHGSGRNAGAVKLSAPMYPAGMPDLDKLARSTLDALTGLLFVDDGQVVELDVTKNYASLFPVGCEIRVDKLPATVAEENTPSWRRDAAKEN